MEDEELEDDINNERIGKLRSEIISCLNVNHFRLSIIHYTKSFPIEERTIVTTDELKKYRRDHLSKWKVKKMKNYPKIWEDMSVESRMKELASYGNHEEFMLKSLLNRLKKEILQDTLRRHFPWKFGKKKKITKSHVIEEILNRLYNKSVSLESRNFEEKNIPSFLEDRNQDRRVVTLCETDIPAEVMHLIFRFHGYNEELVMKIGQSSKDIYLQIISSWRSVTIRKKNVFDYSLLVLGSVRNVKFEVWNIGTDNLSSEELEYIFSKLNPSRLRKITLDMGITSYVRFMKFFGSSLHKSVFRNVTEFSYHRRTRYSAFKSSALSQFSKLDFKNFKELRLRPRESLQRVFPNIQVLNSPVSLNILKGVSSLNSLTFDLNFLYFWKGLYHSKGMKIVRHLFTYFPSFLSHEDDTCLRNLKKLSLRINRFDKNGIMSSFRLLRNNKFLGGNLEVLKIYIPDLERSKIESFSPYLKKNCHFRISDILSNLKNLQYLRLTDALAWGIYSPEENTENIFQCPPIMEVVASSSRREEDFESSFSHNNMVKKVVVKEPGYTSSTLDDLFYYLSLPSLREELRIGVRMRKKGDVNDLLVVEKINEKLFEMDHCHIRIIVWEETQSTSGWEIDLVIRRSRSTTSIFVMKEQREFDKKMDVQSTYRRHGDFYVSTYPFLKLYIDEFLSFVAKKKKKKEEFNNTNMIVFCCFKRMKVKPVGEKECRLDEYFQKRMEKVGFACEREENKLKFY